MLPIGTWAEMQFWFVENMVQLHCSCVMHLACTISKLAGDRVVPAVWVSKVNQMLLVHANEAMKKMHVEMSVHILRPKFILPCVPICISTEYYAALVDVATSLVLFFLTTHHLNRAAKHGVFLPFSRAACP